MAALFCSMLVGLGWQWLQMPSALSSEAYNEVFGNDEATPRLAVSATIHPLPQLTNHYDVLVVGGTPSGVAAALAAARRGARVLLVEARPHLGGDIVYAMLNMFDVPARPGEPSPVHGIFAEFFDQLGVSCDIERARQLFEDTVRAEPNITWLPHTRVARILKESDRVTGAVLETTGLDVALSRVDEVGSATSIPTRKEIAVHTVVDATNDASFAARAGAGYYLGRENANPDKRMQSAGLLFSVSGVDWNEVRLYVRSRRPMYAGLPASTRQALVQGEDQDKTERRYVKIDEADENEEDEFAFDSAAKKEHKHDTTKIVWLRRGGVHGNYAWERGDIVRNYKPRGSNILFLSINFGRQSDGTVVLNTLNIVGVDGLSGPSQAQNHREAMRELPHFIAYLRRTMPGFANAKLAHIAPELYIRETRHIHGHYALKVSDIRAEHQFFDRVASASYPLDLHPYRKDDINPFGPRRYIYTLPLRSLVPRKVDNVFVASRSLSATYSAAGSARVIPITMAAGEAAGAAAWMCAKQNITPHDIMHDSKWVKLLQASLREWGADIGDKLPSRHTAQAAKVPSSLTPEPRPEQEPEPETPTPQAPTPQAPTPQAPTEEPSAIFILQRATSQRRAPTIRVLTSS
jgi:ribulose 1,5-bisphosphate synthetase/thiazole synthase